MDWGKWAFWLAVADFVILVFVGLEVGKVRKFAKKRAEYYYNELHNEIEQLGKKIR